MTSDILKQVCWKVLIAEISAILKGSDEPQAALTMLLEQIVDVCFDQCRSILAQRVRSATVARKFTKRQHKVGHDFVVSNRSLSDGV